MDKIAEEQSFTDEQLKNLKAAVAARKVQMNKRVWQRPDKVVSTIVVGGPGVEIIPNNLRTWLNPRIWLAKLLLAIHFFLYRHVTIGNTRSVIGGRVMMIPLYSRLVAAAVKPYKRFAKKQMNQTLYEVPNEKNSNS